LGDQPALQDGLEGYLSQGGAQAIWNTDESDDGTIIKEAVKA